VARTHTDVRESSKVMDALVCSIPFELDAHAVLRIVKRALCEVHLESSLIKLQLLTGKNSLQPYHSGAGFVDLNSKAGMSVRDRLKCVGHA
jgi:hypothetical protein